MNSRARLIPALLTVCLVFAPLAVDAVERLDITILPFGESVLGPVAIDPAGEFAYVASYGNFGILRRYFRGSVSKFDLTTFERVGQVFVDTDPVLDLRHFQTGFVDPAGTYVYFANYLEDRKSLIRIELENFEEFEALELNWGDLLDSVVDPGGSYAYILAISGFVIKVDLTTFEEVDHFIMDEYSAISIAIDPGGEYLYVGTRERDPDFPHIPSLWEPPKIVKLDLATFEPVEYFTLDGHFAVADAAVHPSGEFAYFRAENQLITVDLEQFQPVASHSIGSTSFVYGRTLVASPSGDYLYYRGSSTWSRFDLNEQVGAGSIEGLGLFLDFDPEGQFIYSSTYRSEPNAGFVKFDRAAMEVVDRIAYEEGIYRIEAAAIDPAGVFGYFGGVTADFGSIWESQSDELSRLVKMNLASMEMVDDITLAPGGGGWGSFTSALMDPAGEYAYLTRRGSVGTVHRLNLANFEWDGSVSFPGISGFLASAISPDGRYGYFVQGGGQVARLDLESFEPAGSVQTNETVLTTATLDPVGRYLYSSTWPSGHLVKVDVQDMALVEVKTGVGVGSPMIIDATGEFGYGGANGAIYKFDLGTFENVASISGAAMNDGAIDSSGRYLYGVSGGAVRRVDLDTFELVESVQVHSWSGSLVAPILHPDGQTMWAPTITPDQYSTVSLVLKIALYRSAQLDHAAVAINGAMPEPFAFDQAGDVIDYTVTMSSNGNVTLTGVNLLEPGFEQLVCEPELPATMGTGDTMTCSAHYTVTQADVDAGGFSTDLTAEIDKADSLHATTHVAAIQSPAVSLNGIVVNGDGFTSVGESIEYRLTATNDGNVTLAGVSINDPDQIFADCHPAISADLAPGDSMNCDGSHIVTPADLDAGHFTLATSVIGIAPDSSPVEDHGSVTAGAQQNPALTLGKQADVQFFHASGDLIDYTITASNAGNVTLTGVTVSAPQLDTLDCQPENPTTLALGAELVCTGSYLVTGSDVVAGSIANTAMADSDQVGPVEATDVVLLTEELDIALDPSLLEFIQVPVGSGQASQTLTLTNTGNGEVAVQFVPELEPPFTVQGGTCLPTPHVIAVNDSCTIIIGFAPDNIAEFSDTLLIETSAPSSPHQVNLNGTGQMNAIPVPVNSRSALATLLILLGLTGWLALFRARLGINNGRNERP